MRVDAGLSKFIRILIYQSLALAIIAAAALVLIWRDGGGAAPTTAFLALMAIELVLFATWSFLVDHAETLWSIRARDRVNAFLIRPLLGGAAVAGAAAAAIGVSSFSAGNALFGPWVQTLAVAAAAGAPLAASVLLAAGSLRHAALGRASTGRMAATLAGDDGALMRIKAALAESAGNAATSARPNPKGFFLGGLSSKPWHETANFRFVAQFEAAFPAILAEAQALAGGGLETLERYKYPGMDTSGWRKVGFIADRRENADNLARCPATAAALRSIPGYPLFRDAMYSVLGPGQTIKPHRDQSNLFLTMHLGLVIPLGGFMEVAGERRPWIAGKALIFDSSYEHQAANPSDAPRVVLLVDFPHPELTEAERRWIDKAPLWRD